MEREEAREEGREEGIILGERKNSELTIRLLESGRLDDLKRAAVNDGYRRQLFAEMGIS